MNSKSPEQLSFPAAFLTQKKILKFPIKNLVIFRTQIFPHPDLSREVRPFQTTTSNTPKVPTRVFTARRTRNRKTSLNTDAVAIIRFTSATCCTAAIESSANSAGDIFRPFGCAVTSRTRSMWH